MPPQVPQLDATASNRPALLPTGIVGLDRILGGGLVRSDVLLLCGDSGAGKTTLAGQLAAERARQGEAVIFVTTAGEPSAEFVRHMRSFSFWDEKLVGKGLFLLSLAIEQELEDVLDGLVLAVRSRAASLLIIDGMSEACASATEVGDYRRFSSRLRAVDPPH